MLIIAHTPTETYIADAGTMTLYDNNRNIVTHGFLRIMAVMLFKNVTAVEKVDYNGNCLYSWQSRKIFA